MITKLEKILEAAKLEPKRKLVVAYANDDHTLKAVYSATEMNLIDATLIGDESNIRDICEKECIDVNKFKIINEKHDKCAAELAVKTIREGKADIIMKGLISSDKYLRAILNKEKGLLPLHAVLCLVTVMEIPGYHKLLILSDAGVLIEPDLNQKIAIVNYLIKVAKSMGIITPKIAVISATEQVLSTLPSCVDAAIISKMAERGQIEDCIIDGPLAFDVAIDKKSARIKKLKSSVAGDADCLLFPNIVSGNVGYKALSKFTNAKSALIVVGAKCPVILTSRDDSIETKIYSISLAIYLLNPKFK